MTDKMFTPEEVGLLLASLAEALRRLDERPGEQSPTGAFLRDLKFALDVLCRQQAGNAQVRPDQLERFYHEIVVQLHSSGAFPRSVD